MAYENDVVRNELTRLTAGVATSGAVPLPDVSGYGFDTLVFHDSEADQRMVGGVEAVVTDVTRRYITDRGTVPSDPDYGLSLVAMLHGGVMGGPRSWEQQVENEALKDPRVKSASCSWVATSPSEHEVSLELAIPTVNGVTTRALVFTLNGSNVEVAAK